MDLFSIKYTYLGLVKTQSELTFKFIRQRVKSIQNRPDLYSNIETFFNGYICDLEEIYNST
jgi:hypothetical protein